MPLKCVLCGGDPNSSNEVVSRDVLQFQCRRCGEYTITHEAVGVVQQSHRADAWKLSACTQERSIQGKPITIYSQQSAVRPDSLPGSIGLDSLIDSFPDSVADRFDRTLLNLARLTKHLGQSINLDVGKYPVLFAQNTDEMIFTLRNLQEEKLITGNLSLLPTSISLTAKGMKQAEDLQNVSKTSISNQETEEIEGVDTEADDLGEYPIDSLLIRQESRSIFEIVRRMRSDGYILDPDFQREFVWDETMQSRLIESAIMRIPLPVFYLAEREDGKAIVVDGLQRLTTFKRYLDNEFGLTGLSHALHLDRLRFSELPPKIQNRIEDTPLILYLIDNKVPEKAKLDIFERVNSGVRLTRQQMRNSIYCGPATRWLKSQARHEAFLGATDGSLNPKTMRDRECINRYCGFALLGVERYKGDMDAYLAETLIHMNSVGQEALERLGHEFLLSMRNNQTVFGEHAFRKHTRESRSRSVINVALFDVYSVVMRRYNENDVILRKEQIHDKFLSLMENEEFFESISYSTNSTRNVQTRFRYVENAMREVMGNVT